MAKDTRQSVFFPDLYSKLVQVAFTQDRLSSYGGNILLSASDHRLGLCETLAECLSDTRQAAKVDHELIDQLRQRVLSIALGCPDGNDAARLREDPMLKLACKRDPHLGKALASQPTLSRFENSVDARALLRMGVALAEKVIAQQAQRRKGRAPRRIVIDIDPTCDPTHGAQQLSLFNGYYHTYCYLPLVVTISFGWERRKYPVAALLRPGTANAMAGTIGVIDRLMDLLRTYFGNTSLYLRADSAFAVPKFFDFLEARGLRYTIAMGSNSVMESLSQTSMEQARAEAAEQAATATVFGQCRYQSQNWPRKRALAFKAQVVVHPDKAEPRDNDRYLIHNLDGRYSPKGVFDFYHGHSDMENRIKELKNDLAMDRTSCSRFLANQFRLLMTLAAYTLMAAMVEETSDRDLLKAQMATLRERLITIAVRVRSSVRRITLELTGHHPWAETWLYTARALGAVPL